MNSNFTNYRFVICVLNKINNISSGAQKNR